MASDAVALPPSSTCGSSLPPRLPLPRAASHSCSSRSARTDTCLPLHCQGRHLSAIRALPASSCSGAVFRLRATSQCRRRSPVALPHVAAVLLLRRLRLLVAEPFSRCLRRRLRRNLQPSCSHHIDRQHKETHMCWEGCGKAWEGSRALFAGLGRLESCRVISRAPGTCSATGFVAPMPMPLCPWACAPRALRSRPCSLPIRIQHEKLLSPTKPVVEPSLNAFRDELNH